MGSRDHRGVRQYRRDPTTSLTAVRPPPEETGEPQPGSASRHNDVPEISPNASNHDQPANRSRP